MYRRSRITYWSSSKFSKWLRTKAGLNNPSALSMEGWREHKQESKNKAPFVHWFTNEFLNDVQRFLLIPSDYIYSIKCFYKNWKGKSHVLDGGLEVGQWYDLCYRVPRCLFNELEKFVEGEKSLATLEWEIGLVYDESWGYSPEDDCYGKPTSQALAAMEQKRILAWWKLNKDRDFSKESGWRGACEGDLIDFFGPKSDEQKAKEKIALDKYNTLEQQYQDEEEQMLIALIKIRSSLWT